MFIANLCPPDFQTHYSFLKTLAVGLPGPP
jgi:hypothetical protein